LSKKQPSVEEVRAEEEEISETVQEESKETAGEVGEEVTEEQPSAGEETTAEKVEEKEEEEEEAEEEGEEIEVVEERTYTIPLRKVWGPPRGKRTPRAMRLLRAFVKRHMKAENVEDQRPAGQDHQVEPSVDSKRADVPLEHAPQHIGRDPGAVALGEGEFESLEQLIERVAPER
jgi:hypothetical protein